MGVVLDLWIRFNRNRHVRKVTGSKITGCTFALRLPVSPRRPPSSPTGPTLTLDCYPPVYAALSISYAAIQVIFLAASWQVNHGAGRQFEVMVDKSGNGRQEFSFIDYRTGSRQLRLCPGGISHARSGDFCPVIWPKPAPSNHPARGESVALTFFPNSGALEISPYDGLTVDNVQPESSITLDPDCVQAIKWPYDQYVSIRLSSRAYFSSFFSLLLKRREDVTAACFHGWLFIMSVTALMSESIPHIGTSFLLHVLALGWSAFQIWATYKFEIDYRFMITGPQGACAGVDPISGYFRDRTTYQIATAVVNFLSTIASGFLCWRLFGVSTIPFCGTTARTL